MTINDGVPTAPALPSLNDERAEPQILPPSATDPDTSPERRGIVDDQTRPDEQIDPSEKSAVIPTDWDPPDEED